VIYTEDTNK